MIVGAAGYPKIVLYHMDHHGHIYLAPWAAWTVLGIVSLWCVVVLFAWLTRG